MRRAALLAGLLTLSGCAAFHQAPPPLARPDPGAATSSSVAGGGGPGAGPSTPPPAAPSPSAPGPMGPPPAPAAPSTTTAPPGPPLTASLPAGEMRKLQDDAQRRIDDAERLLRQIEGRPFASRELETLQLAQSLILQARKALGSAEFERAANLAIKARTLAEDLSTRR